MHHEVSEHKLAGGARLLAIQIPNTITFYWSSSFRAGYRYVPVERYELPHLAEHLAFEGTRSYPDSLAFKVEVERDGTYFNASTDYDQVSYIYSGSREELGRIIPLNLGQIYEPLYGREQVAQEQAVIVEEMSRRREEDGWRLGYLAMHRLIPQRNPDIEARIANVGAIRRADLLAYHQKFYGVANTAFVLAGDYSEAEVEEVADRLNQRLVAQPAGELQVPAAAKFGELGGVVAAHEPYHLDQSLFGLQFARPGRDDGSYPALAIMAMMLTGGLSARLQRKARQAGLTYGVVAAATMHHDYTSLWLRSQTSLDKLEPLVELAAAELAAIGDGQFSDEELERAIGYSVGRLRRTHQTPGAYAGWYAESFVMGEPLESPEDQVRQLEAVDQAAIAQAYRRYISHRTQALTLIGTGLESRIQRYQTVLQRHFA